MPNYSKSIIYKLCCKDPEITDIYVGSTTNFFSRKNSHKSCCNNNSNKEKHNNPVYLYMRLCGGWDNWQMIQIEEVNARDKRHLNQIEAKYIKDLKAKLNSVIPQDIDDGLSRYDYNKQWREKNSDRAKKTRQLYYENNRETIAERMKVYRENNLEQLKENKKQWRENNREKISEKSKLYGENNREKISETKKKYYQKNREKIIEKRKAHYEKNRDKINEKRRQKILDQKILIKAD
jgi:hypothetical protein